MYYVYILTNKSNSVIYIGVTNDIARRVYEHRHHMINGFTDKYHVTKLVYVESAPDIRDAIQRAKKNALVESANPNWEDLWENIL